MKYNEIKGLSFLLDENHFVYKHLKDDESIHIYVKSRQHSCACPVCGEESSQLHATYNRVLQDTPIHCK
jgi:transposase